MTAFIELHFLTYHANALLNADENGHPKVCTLGARTRWRLSSQALKKAYRDGWALDPGELGLTESSRSRQLPALVADRVKATFATSRPLLSPVVDQIAKDIFAKALGMKKLDALTTRQVTVLGGAELDYLTETIEDLAKEAGAQLTDDQLEGIEGDALPKEHRDILRALYKNKLDDDFQKNLFGLIAGAGLSAALFGRMVSGDPHAQMDSAIQVAHAFSLEEAVPTFDYFTAVDELADGTGTAMIGEQQLISGTFYHYCVIDLDGLAKNLTGATDRSKLGEQDRLMLARVVEAFIECALTCGPRARKGSTAPYARAHTVIARVTDHQPYHLTEAFIAPLSANLNEGDVRMKARERLALTLTEYHAMYGLPEDDRYFIAGTGDMSALEGALSLKREPVATLCEAAIAHGLALA